MVIAVALKGFSKLPDGFAECSVDFPKALSEVL